MRVVTGFSSLNDGLLVVTELSLPELADRMGLFYYHLDDVLEFGEHVGCMDLFSVHELDLVMLREEVNVNGLDRVGAWQLHQAEVVQDRNLSEAVMW